MFAFSRDRWKGKIASRPVSRVLYGPRSRVDVTAIPLGRPLPGASSNQPGRRPGNRLGRFRPCRPYSVLLPAGLAVPLPLPVARCALTAPFHPYLQPGPRGVGARRFAFCGAFPGVAPAGRYPAPCLRGARTFLSLAEAAVQPTGATAIVTGAGRRKETLRQPSPRFGHLADLKGWRVGAGSMDDPFGPWFNVPRVGQPADARHGFGRHIPSAWRGRASEDSA